MLIKRKVITSKTITSTIVLTIAIVSLFVLQSKVGIEEAGQGSVSFNPKFNETINNQETRYK